MQEHLQAIITVLSLVNPAICAALFVEIETGRSRWACGGPCASRSP